MYFEYGNEAVEYLKQKDQRLGAVIDQIGHIDRETDPDLFSSVVHHIIGQQISTKAQATDLLVTWLYRLTTNANPQYNVASVIGIVIFVVCAAISLITFNKSGATKNEEAYQ